MTKTAGALRHHATIAAPRPASPPRSSTAADAARLDLALGRPILVVDSTDVDTDGKPLLTNRTRFAAERIEFVVENG